MATLSVIRRWALREQMSIREIARRTGLSRNTVKKYPGSGRRNAALRQADESSKLDPYAYKLATWLAIEATDHANSGAICGRSTPPNPTRRTPSTCPHREAFRLTKRVGQYSMEIQGQRSMKFNTHAKRRGAE